MSDRYEATVWYCKNLKTGVEWIMTMYNGDGSSWEDHIFIKLKDIKDKELLERLKKSGIKI